MWTRDKQLLNLKCFVIRGYYITLVMPQSSGLERQRENASGNGNQYVVETCKSNQSTDRQDPLLRQRAMKQVSRSGAATSRVVESDRPPTAFRHATGSSYPGHTTGSVPRTGGQDQTSGFVRKTVASTARTPALIGIKSSWNPPTATSNVRRTLGDTQNALILGSASPTSNSPLFFSDLRRRDLMGMGHSQDVSNRFLLHLFLEI